MRTYAEIHCPKCRSRYTPLCWVHAEDGKHRLCDSDLHTEPYNEKDYAKRILIRLDGHIDFTCGSNCFNLLSNNFDKNGEEVEMKYVKLGEVGKFEIYGELSAPQGEVSKESACT